MPSGAKKRKAAKKKEIQHNPSSTRTHGDADGDGRESEVSSPDRRNTFSGGEEETEGDNNISTQAVVDEPRDVVMEDSDQKLEHDEIPIKPHEGGSSRGSSTTSSDDETSFEEMKYRRAGNAYGEELREGNKTKLDVTSQDSNNNNNNNRVARAVEEESESKENDEKSIIPRVEGVSVISDTMDECLSVSNNIPIAAGDDHERDSGVSEPLLGSAPRREQTSWKGCCGLLEVFTGSGR